MPTAATPASIAPKPANLLHSNKTITPPAMLIILMSVGYSFRLPAPGPPDAAATSNQLTLR
jgi:hypothetical protein